ncbi:ParB/RepB/Spo0J family partition protein [Streptomyces sp. NBC_00467]|uniref:ParB/RepB/Spo0J family partition protein n=1 Tax=Streptomyces sp. NBC_00467 TaxID=2975752 RepID=UPI002E1988BC
MSLKKDQLGASSSFARAGQARSVRRQLTDAAFGVGDPSVLSLDQISVNPDNPRESLGDISGMASSLTEIGQIQAITVASVEAYLRDRPERASELDPGAEYVVIDGHRRLEGARQAGLATIKVTVDDARVSTDEALLESAFVANAQRENLSDLEEAQALKTLVAFYGSQHKAAKRLGVTQPYISQRLSLLELRPELQADLEAGRRKVEHVRGLGKLSPEEQIAAADARAQQSEEKKQQRKAERVQAPTDNDVITRPTAAPSGATDNDVITQDPGPNPAAADNDVITRVETAAAGDTVDEGDNDVITEPAPVAGSVNGAATDNDAITRASAAPTSTPASRETGAAKRERTEEATDPKHLPWHNPQALNRLAREHMSAEDRKTLAKLLTQE